MNNYIFRSLYASDIDAIDIINMRSLFIVAIFRIFLFIVSFAQGYGNSKLIYSLIFSLIVNHNFVIFKLETQKHQDAI